MICLYCDGMLSNVTALVSALCLVMSEMMLSMGANTCYIGNIGYHSYKNWLHRPAHISAAVQLLNCVSIKCETVSNIIHD